MSLFSPHKWVVTIEEPSFLTQLRQKGLTVSHACQNFTVSVNPENWRNLKDEQFETMIGKAISKHKQFDSTKKLQLKLPLRCVGVHVVPNKTIPPNEGSEPYLVPVMLWNAGIETTIRIDCTEEADLKKKQTFEFLLTLSKTEFPDEDLSGKWSETTNLEQDEKGNLWKTSSIDSKELKQEQWMKVPNEQKNLFILDTNLTAGLLLTIDKVINEKTHKPLTYFIDRVYALTAFAFFPLVLV